jgi:hypothetical protein
MGAPIQAEEMKRIFEPFHGGPGSSGLGVGLYGRPISVAVWFCDTRDSARDAFQNVHQR